MSTGRVIGWTRSPFDNRRASDPFSVRHRKSLWGAAQSHWLHPGQELSQSKVWVAADYSNSVPDSPKYIWANGYHPLEEVKECKRSGDKMLSDAEIARTALEAHSSALLVVPGPVHAEPHEHLSWDEFQYVIDDYGDIFFDICDDENLLQDVEASNPVNVLIGMDLPMHFGGQRSESGSSNIISFDDYIEEMGDTEVASTLIDWGMPDTLRRVHPVYFSKCLAKAVHANYGKKMDHPSNGLSIVGCLRPAFIDEELHLRKLFHGEDVDDYVSDWREESGIEEDQMPATYNLIGYGGSMNSTLYKLEIMWIELFSVYGYHSRVTLQDFQEAEPDVLVHSASTIVEHFTEYEMKCSLALRALCRKRKGLNVEGANLIGVDSLGMDVRVFSGVEAQTLRFSFNTRVLSESSAKKKIQGMLFPRYYRRNSKAPSDGLRESNSL